MGAIQTVLPVKLFTGVLCAFPDLMPSIREKLAREFGPLDLEAGPFPFDSTTYYDETMGTPLSRCFFSIEKLAAPEALAPIKIRTNELEAEFRRLEPRVTRPVNLDPGYLEQSKVILFSTKNFYHRILIAKGIYAEVTQHFENGEWQRFPWTFPDFRTARYDPFFTELRKRYRGQLHAAAD